MTDLEWRLGESEGEWLRPLHPDDASQNYLAWLREASSVFGASHLPQDLDELRADIAARHVPPRDYLLGIFVQAEHAGNLSLHVDRRKRIAEVGILVGSEYRGRGIAKRAHVLALNWAFDSLGLRKIWAGHLSDNEQAAALYSSLGFQREALLRRHELINEVEHDVIRVGMLAAEWRARQDASGNPAGRRESHSGRPGRGE